MMKTKKIFIAVAVLFILVVGVDFVSATVKKIKNFVGPSVTSPSSTTSVSTSTDIIDTSDWRTFSGTTSKISLRVPAEAVVEQTYGGTELSLRVDEGYFQSLGIVGTTSVTLDISVGTDVMSTADAPSNCATNSSNPTGIASSSALATISGQLFYDVQNSDAGMSQYIQGDRYVQLNPNGSCRYFSFRYDTAQPGAYTDDPAQIQEIRDNNTRANIPGVETAILQSVVVK